MLSGATCTRPEHALSGQLLISTGGIGLQLRNAFCFFTSKPTATSIACAALPALTITTTVLLIRWHLSQADTKQVLSAPGREDFHPLHTGSYKAAIIAQGPQHFYYRKNCRQFYSCRYRSIRPCNYRVKWLPTIARL